ncbi:MAG TPA: hypothetical protein VF026_18460 [Ktedonobacteraceae bacterium]
MTKRTITTWWLIGVIVMVVGGVLALFSSLALVPHIQNLSANFQSNNFVLDSSSWTLISLIVLGGIAVLGGIVVQFVTWIGAVINTNRLVDKTWFNVLLWCGLAGILLGSLFGLGAMVWLGLMIAYLVGGPDGMAVEPMLLRATPTESPKTLAPTG